MTQSKDVDWASVQAVVRRPCCPVCNNSDVHFWHQCRLWNRFTTRFGSIVAVVGCLTCKHREHEWLIRREATKRMLARWKC